VIHVGIAEAADPHVMHRVGELVSRLGAAYALLDCPSRLLEAAEFDPSLENVESGRLGGLEAKPAGEIASELFILGGTSAPSDAPNLHRHWRDARTHTLHDPARWKYHTLGEHPFTGVLPGRHPLA
jgi:alkylation response protein AidB-like acyl-CoA dehydrogenase